MHEIWTQRWELFRNSYAFEYTCRGLEGIFSHLNGFDENEAAIYPGGYRIICTHLWTFARLVVVSDGLQMCHQMIQVQDNSPNYLWPFSEWLFELLLKHCECHEVKRLFTLLLHTESFFAILLIASLIIWYFTDLSLVSY